MIDSPSLSVCIQIANLLIHFAQIYYASGKLGHNFLAYLNCSFFKSMHNVYQVMVFCCKKKKCTLFSDASVKTKWYSLK